MNLYISYHREVTWLTLKETSTKLVSKYDSLTIM